MSSTKEIQEKGRSLKILNKLNSQRSNKKFCDVELVVAEEEFPTHRNVLAASSEYFDAMFSSKMKEQHERKVSIKGITPRAMTLVLDFIYIDIITLTDECVGEVLQAASLLRILELQDIINEYLVEALKPSTCLSFRNLGRIYSLENVVVEAEKCLKEKFQEVSVQADFCNLEVTEVESLISSDEITVACEIKVFDAVVGWVKSDTETRSKYFQNLFKHVRLQLISLDYLSDKVRTETLVRESSACRDLVEDAFHFHANPLRFRSQIARKGQNNPGSTSDFILCFGGLSIVIYKPSDQTWTTLMRSGNHDLTSSAVVPYGAGALFCGGMENGKPTNKVALFTGWDFQSVAPMNVARMNASAVCIRGDVLVFGGDLSTLHTTPSRRHQHSDFCKIAKDFEIFEFGKKQWKVGGNLPTGPRSEAAAVVVNELIYLLGGYNNRIPDPRPGYHASMQVKQACNLVDVYNHSTKLWTSSNNMSTARAAFGAAALNNRIYCVGGMQNSNSQVSSSEFFDISTGQWTNFAAWSGPSSICHCDGKIFALRPYSHLCSVNTGQNGWSNVQVDQNVSRCQQIVSISRRSF
ncbi:kelch-like protein 12 [Clavelina lepadiformis]|uniref:kelch-like protein 12 n=1 Tax=Clavelina lepadiformis TaxID=159417 RepID=UPI004041AAC0